MKPHKTIRKAKGYCCVWCDGPYNKWKKKTKRSSRKTERQTLKREVAPRRGFDPRSAD